MDFDDIVIGSGLTGLGVVLGLDPARRVLVVCGPAQGSFSYYTSARSVPCAYLGAGGLGSYWHGVIPTGWRNNFGNSSDDAFARMFARFYPRAPIRDRLGTPSLFVPWRPIRPRAELARLASARGGRLILLEQIAENISLGSRDVALTAGSLQAGGRRLWLAAGAMHTPALLGRILGRRVTRPTVSDHVLCYVGQVDGFATTSPVRTPDGIFFPATYGPAQRVLYTLRPARFAFRRLDHGIEQRAAFGLPTGGAIAKITRSMSPGLIAEAFYNRFGLFGRAARHSIYAQVPVADAYRLDAATVRLEPDAPLIARATEQARDEQPFTGARRSNRPDLHLPGIHLHHSLDLDALADAGVDAPGGTVHVVDGSAVGDIGPDHHAFKMLLAAAERARQITATVDR